GLEPQGEVIRGFPTREQVAEFVSKQFEDAAVLQSIEMSETIYKAFGLLEPDVDLMAVYEALLASQVGGYYDPATKEMNTLLLTSETLGDTLPLLERIVYVHEFTHALQDQNFGLDVILPDELSLTEPDRALAVLSLVEGDATQVMTDYLTALTERDPAAVLRQMDVLTSTAASMEIPPGTPEILTEELLFPYTQGQRFVQALIAEGGYAAVDAAFTDLPTSSEHIIYPETYLAGDEPDVVTVEDSSELLGEGWAHRYEFTAGAAFIRNWARPMLGGINASVVISGWGGDRYRLYENADGEAAWVWRMTFDTAEDAAEVVELLPTGFDRAYGDAVEAGVCWQSDAYGICFQAEGDLGVLITRAPSAETARELLR
nr:hypothetical protein [Anaerolineae bacterium]